MIIMKFGGTSVGSAERIRVVHDIVKSRLNRDPIVVVSAVGGITDKLINTANLAFQGGDYSAVLNEIREKHYTIIKELELVKIPGKNTQDRNKLKAMLDELGKLEEASDIDRYAINKIIKEKKWDQEILNKLGNYVKMEISKRLVLSNK